MLRFFAKRLLDLLITMVAVSVIIFLLLEFTPGDVAQKILGPFATKEQVAILTEELGLNRPVWIRYFEWVGQLLTGDLGFSTTFKVPVNDIIWDRLGSTLRLAAIAFLIMVPLSTVLGVLAGMREGGKLDRSISVLSIATTSIPEFASGVFLATIFVILLGWLPGTSTLSTAGGWPIWTQYVLPVTVVLLYYVGYLVRMVRASMVEVMTRPYIRTAILKGLDFRAVIWKHAFRNAMITPVTVFLLQINFLITSLVVVEIVFAYPGFGRMILEAALAKDYAVIEAGALIAVFIAVSTQVVGDLGYMILNPRIRFK
ncbi:MAG: ABC transporter permease [Rhodospirillaceae bacterium]|nr:ABC transporter permease [Rhodospirillaceae bacterium]